MRRTALIALLLAIPFHSASLLTAIPAGAQSEICGDFDGSGSLVASDALLLLKKAVGQNVIVECPACASPVGICGDVDESGGIVASDALRLLRRAVGQDVTIECPSCPVTTTLDTCAELGEQCSSAEDCCEVPPPPFPPPAGFATIGDRGSLVPAICCGGKCYSSGICAGKGIECDCNAQCCSGSCGAQTPGICD